MASGSDQGGYYAAGMVPSDGVVASTPPRGLEPLIVLSRIVRRLVLISGCNKIPCFLAFCRPKLGVAATIRRLCVPRHLLAISALRVSRDGCEVVHPLNSRSQYPEMEQIASFARIVFERVQRYLDENLRRDKKDDYDTTDIIYVADFGASAVDDNRLPTRD